MKRKKINQLRKETPNCYISEYENVELLSIKHRTPFCEAVPLRGSIILRENSVEFRQSDPVSHKRNKNVFKSKYFSVVETDEGAYHGRFVIPSNFDFKKQYALVMLDFAKILSLIKNNYINDL